MLKDYQESQLDVLVMSRGTDRTHLFQYIEDTGSSFNWGLYNVTCEARLSTANAKADFLVPVTPIVIDGVTFGILNFSNTLINNSIRENRIYWRVVAEHKIELDKIIINRGKIYLSEV